MADQPIKLTPLGNLDKDTDYNFIREGNYVDALDVIKQDDAGNVSGTTQPTQRNKHAFSLGEVVAQNKKYRITVVPNSGANGNHAQHAITIRSLAGDHMVNYNGPVSYPEVTDGHAVQFTSTYTGFQASWADTSNNNLFNVTYPTLPGQTYPVIEIELINYAHYDYIIGSVGPDPVKIECIQEAIPTDLTGLFKDIGSYDMLGDLFILSTPQDSDPLETGLVTLSVGPISTILGQEYFTGPLTTMSFTTDHDLQVGQAISISNSNQPFLNGSFIVNNVISATEIAFVTSTAWGNSYPVSSGFLGDEVITINPIGMGEIGVAKKDNATETWSYTRLLRSKELNFTTLHSVDSFANKDSKRKSIYFTDNFNPPGVFYYRGPYIEDGALEYVNSLNPYSYGDIAIEVGLQTSVKPVNIDLVSVVESGGNLIAGTKYYTVRQKTLDGDESPMSSPFGPVIVHNLDPKNQGVIRSYAIAAEETTEPSEIRVELKLSNLDPGAYPIGEIIVVESIGGVITSSIIHEFQIPTDGVYEYTHTGFEEGITISTSEVLASGIREFSQVLIAKNISSIDSRNVLSNVSTIGDLDLSNWTKTFTHTLFKDEIKESTLNKSGEYQQAEITFDNLGLMMNETYRFGARVYLRGVGWTPFYWVDDIMVDNEASNNANQSDNRRDGTFLDYQLTDNQDSSIYGLETFQENYNNLTSWTGVIPTSTPLPLQNLLPIGVPEGGAVDFDGSLLGFPTNYPGEEIVGSTYGGWLNYFNSAGSDQYRQKTKYYVPKIKFNIIWDFLIPGGSRKNLLNEVEAIEFGIGNLPNNIKASGIAVLSTKTEGNHTSSGGWAGSTYADSGDVHEFDFQPFGFTGGALFSLAEIVNIAMSAFPKYPYSGFSNSGTREKEVRDVFTFYSPDTSILASESGSVSGANGLVAPSTHVLVHGTYGRHKAFYGSPGNGAETSGAGGTNDFGVPTITLPDRIVENISDAPSGNILGYNPGVFSILHPFGPDYDSVEEIEITNTAFIDDQDGEGSVGGNTYKVWDSIHSGWTSQFGSTALMPESSVPYISRPDKLVFETASDIEYGLGPYYDRTDVRKMDQGLHYVQMYSDVSAAYPSKEDTEYIKIGGTSFFSNTNIPDSVSINGGDTSTSLFFYRHRGAFANGQSSGSLTAPFSGDGSNLAISGSMIGYVSQSRSNLKSLKVFAPTEDPVTLLDVPDHRRVYPYDFYGQDSLTSDDDVDVDMTLERRGVLLWTIPDSTESLTSVYNLNIDYSFLNVINGSQGVGFQETESTEGLNTKPTRITWSNRKLPGESLDSYRVFLPLSYKDLDFTFGQINDHQDINGELFTLQPRKFQFQHFNSRGTLQTTDGSIDIVVGESSVLNRDGKTLSSYGTDHKWSVIKGASPGGKDVVYWFNQENGLFMRFGADGSVVLSDRAGMRSFSANNTRWTEDQHTPALNYGIRSVWDDRFKEAIWTFIGIRETRGDWGSGNRYYVGDIVVGGTANNYPLDDIPDLYICAANHVSTEDTAPGSVQNYWTAVDKDDPEYYSVFTLAFNELSNGFSTFYSHLPKTYLKWKNKFLSSHPLHRNELYEHRYGYDKWYEYEGVWKESEPFVEGVVNYIPEQSKKFVAIQSLSDNVPDKIELRTKDHESFLVSADFDPEDDAWRSPIKNDILTSSTSDPNDDTVSLLGSYMRVKFKFFNGAYNKMNNLIIKVRDRLRRTGS